MLKSRPVKEIPTHTHISSNKDFSMWWKVRRVAAGIFIGLVALAIALVEVEIEDTENTDCKICVEWVP